MIWLWVLLLVAFAAVFIWPVLNGASPISARSAVLRELAASKTQLAQIEAEIETGFQDEETAARAKRAMQRRILYLGEKLDAIEQNKSEAPLKPQIRFGVPAALIIGTLALYPVVGAPGYSREAATPKQFVVPEKYKNMSLQELIAELEDKLNKQTSPDPLGYIVLARTKMSARDIDGAIAAYEVALKASDNDERIAAELKQIRSIKARLEAGQNATAPKLDQDQIDAMNALTPEQREAQINAMIDGLAAKLEDDPKDIQGWLRLIRARSVQGKTEQVKADLATARKVFEGDEQALSLLNDMENNLPAPMKK